MGEDLQVHTTPDVDAMYREWFLNYASYVILDRAIPEVDDGLKPVQRRLLHALHEMDDGRFNKAANVIGHTMRYHPHGDMAISEALVKLAQKGLLIETQGNWGNLLTGDQAAAPRYIEARLTPFAQDVLFEDAITDWQASYDGRSKEPLVLPTKFPLLLFLGAEGIAVGLATKILPHNFCELIKESIAVLRGHKPQLIPDFPGGGIADYSEYLDGRKGSKIKVRARIEVTHSRQLCIREIPFGTTTTSLIDSILAANDKGVVKVKKIEDNTAQDIEILIHLHPGASPDQVIAGLYAFTDCEVSLTPNACVISQNKPLFCTVSDLLVRSTQRTKALLQRSLEHERGLIQNRLHMALLEKVFVEQRIYRKIEGAESWDSVLSITQKAFRAHIAELFREPELSDIEKVLDLRIKRIAKYDLAKTEETIAELKKKLADIENSLANLTAYCINYFKEMHKKYGKLFPRKTEIASFAPVSVSKAAISNLEVFIDRKEGFVGTSLKGHESLGMASEFSEIITLSEEGKIVVHRVCDKLFVGKGTLYAGFFQNNERCVYHLIYKDGKDGSVLAKRFHFTSYTRSRMYDVTKGTKGSKVLYFSVQANGEQEKVRILLKSNSLLKNAEKLDFDFSKLAVKSRQLIGTEIAQGKVDSVVRLLVGASTLQAQRVWFDRKKNQLNADGEGVYLGKYSGEESLIAVYSSGSYEIIAFDWNYHFSPDLLDLKFFNKKSILTVECFDSAKKDLFSKRIESLETQVGRYDFIPRRANLEVRKVEWE
jgi:topoisomerase-4 subunit A